MILGRASTVRHGVAGGPASTVLTGVRECTYQYSADAAESKDRDSAFASNTQTLREGSVSLVLTWTGHASQVAILTAMLARNKLFFELKDSKGYGLEVDCVIKSFGRAEPLADHLTIPIQLEFDGEPTGIVPPP